MPVRSVYGIDPPAVEADRTIRNRARIVANRVIRSAKATVCDPRVIGVAIFLFGVLVVGFACAWVSASRTIDEHLGGHASAARSGVFAAPLVVRAGQPLALDDLVSYLQQLGYSSDATAATSGGVFAVDGDTVRIDPRDRDGSGAYAPVRVEFSKGGVRSVIDDRTGKAIEQASLEPLMISTGGGKEKRIPVTYEAIPERLRNAIVATEDRRFWSHNGVDYRGLARAARTNFDDGDVVQGGSTLTQQLVKNIFLTSERSYSRKVKEAFLSYVLESKLSKQEIFSLYCNEIYLGQSGTYSVHGVGEAAQLFFGKDLSALTLDESALLAALINSPNANSPYRHADRAKQRRDLVLDMMVETGALPRADADTAKSAPIALAPVTRDSAWLDAPYFDDYVRDYCDEIFAGTDSGSGDAGNVRVDTTIDINLQRAASAAVNAQLQKLDTVLAKGSKGSKGARGARGAKGATEEDDSPPGSVQAALVALDPTTGAVLAMVGGRDYATSQLNRATDAMRQPGSVFKPFVYATALSSRRFTAATPVLDAPQTFTYSGGTYEPGNFGEKYSNKVIPLRFGLRYSKNVVTVAVAMQTGLDNIASTAQRAGLPRPEAFPAMALGTSEATPLEIAGAYTAFAGGGRGVEPTPLAASSTVKVAHAAPRTVFSPQVAYVMTNLMEDVVARGTAAGVRARGVRGAIAGKTGTSRDGWFAGYSPHLVCVVWVGFDDNRQLGLTGADSALPIWADFMKQAVAFKPELGGDRFPIPSGIATAKVCDESGLLAGDFCPASHDEIFVAGTEPSAPCTIHMAEVTDAIVPLFDENGTFIGYGPATEAEDEQDTTPEADDEGDLPAGTITLPPDQPDGSATRGRSKDGRGERPERPSDETTDNGDPPNEP